MATKLQKLIWAAAIVDDLIYDYEEKTKKMDYDKREFWITRRRIVVGLMQQKDGSTSMVLGEATRDRPEDPIERLHEAAFRVALARRG